MDENDENVVVANRNFTKLSNNLTNMGYADGKADGQESVFQKCFDQGFEKGFHIGFNLGRCHGKDFAMNSNDSQIEAELVLKKPSRGHCQICIDQQLINEPIDSIISKQTEHNASIDKIISEKF